MVRSTQRWLSLVQLIPSVLEFAQNFNFISKHSAHFPSNLPCKTRQFIDPFQTTWPRKESLTLVPVSQWLFQKPLCWWRDPSASFLEPHSESTFQRHFCSVRGQLRGSMSHPNIKIYSVFNEIRICVIILVLVDKQRLNCQCLQKSFWGIFIFHTTDGRNFNSDWCGDFLGLQDASCLVVACSGCVDTGGYQKRWIYKLELVDLIMWSDGWAFRPRGWIRLWIREFVFPSLTSIMWIILQNYCFILIKKDKFQDVFCYVHLMELLSTQSNSGAVE